MIQAAEIERMDVEKRLQAMELLWASLARMPEAMPSPEWHGEAISDRLAKIERGEGEFPTLSQLKQRLQTSTP